MGFPKATDAMENASTNFVRLNGEYILDLICRSEVRAAIPIQNARSTINVKVLIFIQQHLLECKKLELKYR